MTNHDGRDSDGPRRIPCSRWDRLWNQAVSLWAVAAATIVISMTLRIDLKAEDPPSPDTQDVVRARKIELVDAAGVVRCSMEVVGEHASIKFKDTDGSDRMTLGIKGKESYPYLIMWGDPGKSRVALGANPQPGLVLSGDSGHPIFRAVVQKNQEIHLEASNPDGEVYWRAK